jgi:hypothetical protein
MSSSAGKLNPSDLATDRLSRAKQGRFHRRLYSLGYHLILVKGMGVGSASEQIARFGVFGYDDIVALPTPNP